MKFRVILAVLVASLSLSGHAQIRISTLENLTYTQNFNALPAPAEQTPWSWINDGQQTRYGMTGWYIATLLANSTKPISSESAYLSAAGKNPNAACAANFGAAGDSDRAIGFRMSIKGETNAKHRFYAGVVFVNDTKRPIGRVAIAYTGEQWSKVGPAPEAVQTLRVAIANVGAKFDPAKFAVHAIAPVAEVGSLTFQSSGEVAGANRFGAKGPLHTAERAAVIAFPRALAPGEHFLLLWTAVGNGLDNGAHALALDDVRVQFEPAN